jgi:hypothetical protein
MTSPAPSSTLTSSSVTFTWTAGTGVTQYDLYVGTTGVGSSNIKASGALTALTYSVSSIPSTGGTVYVRLLSLIAGAWQHVDYTYTEASFAQLTSPTPGSTLTGSTATFTWTAGTGVKDYDLYVGTTGVGSSNIKISGGLTAQTYTVTNIPITGGALYVRLLSLVSGVWQSVDFTYTEADLVAPAVMSTPAPGSTLTGSSATFTWTTGTGVTDYDLYVGTTGVGSSNIKASGGQTGQTFAVSGIPTTGGTLYVRLLSLIDGAWQHNDYTYTEANFAQLTSPTPGSTLTGSTATFTWTAGTGVKDYDLYVGTTGVGSSNIKVSGGQTALTYAVSGIPVTDGVLYVRLLSLVSGVWQSVDYTYKEADLVAPAMMSTPTPGSTLTGSSAAFTWTAGSGVADYDLYVGTTGVGSSNIKVSGAQTGLTYTVSGIPTAGGTVYVRLLSLINGVWQSNDYIYTEAP